MNKKSNTKRTGFWHLLIPKFFIIIFIAFLCTGIALAAQWVQDDWSGGAKTAVTAIDPGDRTGWTNYYQKTDEITASDSAVTITELSGTRVLTTYNDFYPAEDTIRTVVLGEWDKDDATDGKIDFVFPANLASIGTYTITTPNSGYTDNGGVQLKDGLIYPQAGTQGWQTAEASVLWGTTNTPAAGTVNVTFDLGRVYGDITSLEFYVGGGVSLHVAAAGWTPAYTDYLDAPSQIRVYVAPTTALYNSSTADASIANTTHWETVDLSSLQQGRYLSITLSRQRTYLSLGEVKIETTNYNGLDTGVYISKSIDIGKNVSSWGTFDWTDARAGTGGAVTAKVCFSADNSTWTDWYDIAKGGDLSTITDLPANINSKYRYLKYRFDFTEAGGASPCIDDVTINYKYYPTGAEVGYNANTLFEATYSNPAGSDADYSKAGSIVGITHTPENHRTYESMGMNSGKYGEGVYLSDEDNLLKNSNFSYYSGNNFTYWVESVTPGGASTVTVDTETKLGEKGASVKCTEVGTDTAQIYQTIYVKSNTTYTLSFYVKGDGDNDADYLNAYIRSYDVNDTDWHDYNASDESWTATSQQVYGNIIDITDDWVKQSITFTTRDLGQDTRMIIYLTKGSTGGYWYIDNALLNETPGGTARMGWTYGQDIVDNAANDGLMALYHFDNNFYDSYGTGSTLTGAAVTFDSTDKKFGAASAVFNAATDIASTSSTIYIGDPVTGVTVEAWVKITSDTTGNIIHNTWSGVAGKWRLYYVAGGTLRFDKYTATTFSATKSGVTLNEWHHVVGTYDGANVRVYVDGEEGTPAATTGNVLNNQIISFGRATASFIGKIDEAAIYSYAMTPAEINTRFGKDVLRYSATSNLPIGDLSTGSIELWVKPDWDGNDFQEHYFFDMVFDDTNINKNSIRIYKDASNVLHFLLGDAGGTSYLDAYISVNATNFAKGTWHHIVATWDGIQTIKLYLDGVLVNSDQTGGSAYVSTLATYFFVGSDFQGRNQADAIIDDVRISNKVITAAMVADYYNGNYMYVSNMYNTASGQSIITPLTWTNNGNDEIKFQLRTATDNSGVPDTWTIWKGPQGTASDYYTTSGEDLFSDHSDGVDDQWIQYRVYLKTDDSSKTPEITALNIGYESSRFTIVSEIGENVLTTQAGVIVPFTIKYIDQHGDVDTSLSQLVDINFSGATPNAAGYIPRVGRYADLSENPDTFPGAPADVGDVVSFNDQGETPYLKVLFQTGTATLYVQLYDVTESPITFNTMSTIGLTTINPLVITLESDAPATIAWVTDPQETVVAGETWTPFSAEVLDQYQNRVTTSTNTVTIATNQNEFDEGTTSKVEVSGLATFDDLKYYTANPTLSVEASVDVAGIDPITDTIAVTHDDASKQFKVESIQDMTAGGTSDVKVTCQDQYGNIYTDYVGTVHFKSTDPVAVLPSDTPFLAEWSGVHTFTGGVSLKTAITAEEQTAGVKQSVTVTDTVADTVTGSQQGINVTPAELTSTSIILPGNIAAANGSVVGKGGGDTGTLINFTIPETTPIPADGKIVIDFGVDGNTAGDFTFDYQGTTVATSPSLDGLLTVSYEGQTVTITRAAGTAKTGSIALTLKYVRNPASWGSTGTFSIKTENVDGGVMAEKTDIPAKDIIGIVFTTPTTGTVLSVGQTNVPLTYTEGGTSNNYLFKYFDGSLHSCTHSNAVVQGAFSDGGDTVYWDIPGAGNISSGYYVLALDLTLGAEVGRSEYFAVSGAVNITAPVTDQQVSYQTPFHLTWTETGTYSLGVFVEYSTNSTDGVNGDWAAIAAYSTAADAISDDADNSNALTNRLGSGIGALGTYWLPSRNLGGGVSSLWLRVSDAYESDPPSHSSVRVVISDITSINFTLPGRDGTAVRVGDILPINISRVGVTNVKIEYKSKITNDYVVCAQAIGPSADDVDTTESLPYNWKVPDDVYPDAGSSIRVTATDTSNISGALSKVSDPFTIYGSFTTTKPAAVQGESYSVDDSTDRVPIEWTGSKSIDDVYFEYATTIFDPIWTNLIGVTDGEVYDDATEGTAGAHNWSKLTGSGTVWWQPKFTGNNIYVRVVDINDPDTASVPTVFQSFAISGVSLLGVTNTADAADRDYLPVIEVGTTKYIKGTGTTNSNTVNLYYDTDPNFTNPVYIATASIDDEGRFAYLWLNVVDEISDSIYFKVENPDDTNIFNGTTTPIAIKGALRVDTPVSAWEIGATDKSVTGTVTGDIDSIDLQYTVAADPQEADWTDIATDIPIGDHSGTVVSTFTIPAGSFTVPDAISNGLFKIRVKDSTDGRAADALAVSPASNGFQVKGYISVVSPDSSSDIHVGMQANIQYMISGSSTGDLAIYYGYRKGATEVDDPDDASWTWVTTPFFSLDHNDPDYMGTGVTPVQQTYSWTAVPNVVATLLRKDGLNEQDPDVYTADDNKCWMILKIKSVNSDAIAYSESFRVKYYKITWAVKNVGGGYLSELNVSEAPYPVDGSYKQQWSVLDHSLAIPSGLFDRYYPGSWLTTETNFSKLSGGTDYSEKASWQADSDKTVTVIIDTSPIVVWDVSIKTIYDYSTSTLNVSSWIQRLGLQLNAQQMADLGGASIKIFDSNGNQVNHMDITDPAADQNGVYWFSWDTANDLDQDGNGVSLIRGKQYLVLATIEFGESSYSASDIFTLESATTYSVQVETVYDANTDSLIINTSLLEAGNLVTDVTKTSLSYCSVFDTSGNEVSTDISGDLTTPAHTETDMQHAIFHTTWGPNAGIETNKSYTIISRVTYAGTVYSGTKTYSLEGQSAISGYLASIEGKVDTVQSTVEGVGTTVSGVDTSVGNLSAQVAGYEDTQAAFRDSTTLSLAGISSDVAALPDAIGAIQTAIESTLPDLITSSLDTQLAKGVQSEILTRPTSVEPGTTTTIRYRTKTGLSPRIKVYDANNNIRVNSAVMSEIGSTGIYEYDLTLDEAWGLGEYTIVCSETTTGATDSMVLNVSTANIDSMAAIIDALSTKMDNLESTITSAILPIADKVDSMRDDMTTMDGLVSDINDATTGLSTDMDTINTAITSLETDVGTTATNIGAPTDAAGTDTLFGKLASIGQNSDSQQTLVDQVTSVSEDINNTKEDLTSYINNVENLLGTTNDTVTTDTIFGKIATLEANLADMSPSVTNSETYSRSARTEATAAAETAADIKAKLMSDNIEEINKAVAMVPQLASTLDQLQGYLNKLPEMGAVDIFTDQVKDALKALGKLAADKGFNKLVPSADTFTPEDMQDVRNMVIELKSMMKQVRGLLDKQVNKPVVEGWLEEGK